MPETSDLWTLDRVTLGRGPRPRLDAVSLSIRPGVTAVLGHSGAGKTSLLNLLVGFEKTDAGGIAFCPPAGRLPLFWGPPDDGLWPHWTAAEHVRRVTPRGTSPEDWLRALDLGDMAGVRPDRLSQGERSRLSLARALASRAGVLVLDEPLEHVDPWHVGRYRTLLRDQVRATGTSLVFATHAPEAALLLADQVICLESGRLAFTGDPQTLYRTPPTERLAWALGPVNWLTREEWPRWFEGISWPEPSRDSVCLRPEQVSIAPQSDGGLKVIGARSGGAILEVDLQTESKATRTWHVAGRNSISNLQFAILNLQFPTAGGAGPGD